MFKVSTSTNYENRVVFIKKQKIPLSFLRSGIFSCAESFFILYAGVFSIIEGTGNKLKSTKK
jgi:hypothetical protein